MSSHNTPYIERHPGDAITAEDWNDVQVQIRGEIEEKVGEVSEALAEHEQAPVDAAKFGGLTPDEWSEKFAPKVHDHEGTAAYRRYYKRFTVDTPATFLHHDLARYPLVDAYELLEVVNHPEVRGRSDNEAIKFFLYYAHEEAEQFNQVVKVYRERVTRGIPLPQLLDELGVDYEDDDTFQDVRNELWDALGAAPNDDITHAFSPWVEEKCIARLKIKELKENDEWPDIRLAYIPQKLELCCGQPAAGEARPMLRVTQVAYDTLLLEAENLGDAANRPAGPFDVMILLRS